METTPAVKAIQLNDDEKEMIAEIEAAMQLQGALAMAVRSRGLHKQGEWDYRAGALHLREKK
jgi:hypothetical protein